MLHSLFTICIGPLIVVVDDREEWWNGSSTTQSGLKLSTISHKERAHGHNSVVRYLNTWHAPAAWGPDSTELAGAVNSCWPNQLYARGERRGNIRDQNSCPAHDCHALSRHLYIHRARAVAATVSSQRRELNKHPMHQGSRHLEYDAVQPGLP